MGILDLDKIRAAEVKSDPFTHFVCEGAVRREYFDRINKDWPVSGLPGSVPMQCLDYGPEMQRFVSDLQGSELAAVFEDKFGVALADYPTMVTIRNICRPSDGKIHTDSKTKVITVLVYMPEQDNWGEEQGGRLRLLRSPSLDDYVDEVEPKWGTMLAFVNSDTAWHGHSSFDGSRRVLQLNWVTSVDVVKHEQQRHNRSYKFKKMKAAIGL